MRLQTFYLLNIQLDTKDRFTSTTEMMPFIWDEKSEEINNIGYTTEDWEELDKIYLNNKEA